MRQQRGTDNPCTSRVRKIFLLGATLWYLLFLGFRELEAYTSTLACWPSFSDLAVFILVKNSETVGKLQNPVGLTPWLSVCCYFPLWTLRNPRVSSQITTILYSKLAGLGIFVSFLAFFCCCVWVILNHIFLKGYSECSERNWAIFVFPPSILFQNICTLKSAITIMLPMYLTQ